MTRFLILLILLAAGCSKSANNGPADMGANNGADAADEDADDPSNNDADADTPTRECDAGPWSVSSPNGLVVVDLEARTVGDDPPIEALHYRVTHDGTEVIEWSQLGLETDGPTWADHCVKASNAQDVSGSYTALTGKRLDRVYAASELELTVHNPDDAPLTLLVRAHDDGFAHRYDVASDDVLTVLSEMTEFVIPADSRAWMSPYDLAGTAFGGGYEQSYREVRVGQNAPPNSSWGFPVLFDVDGTFLLLSESDLDRSYAGTRLHGEPDETRYQIRFPTETEGRGVGETQPSGAGFRTPWRLGIIGDGTTLVQSTLVDDLARASVVADTSWIQPGRVGWSWFSQETGDADLQRAYVAFAARMGWEYVLIDANWDEWPSPDTLIPMLAQEADAQGVKLMLWYNSGGAHSSNPVETPLDLMDTPEARQAEMAKIAGWGIAGIKIDFFNSDKQDRIQQYIDILEDADDHQLLVNFHGATIPRGWQRTYPHLMTHEAVRGEEFFKFIGSPSADDHVWYVFIRNVIGSMDYTPSAFDRPFEDGGRAYAHSLALSVLFESGLQNVAGRADGDPGAGLARLFASYPFVEPFLADLPATWDETQLLAGDPATHAVLARRKGSEWWLAAVNATEQELVATIELDFLTLQSTATCIEQDQAPDSLVENVTAMDVGVTTPLRIPAESGFACRITAR